MEFITNNTIFNEIVNALKKDSNKIINILKNETGLLTPGNLNKLLQLKEYHYLLLDRAIINKMFDLIDFLFENKVKIDYIQPITKYNELLSKEYDVVIHNNVELNRKIIYDFHRYDGLL